MDTRSGKIYNPEEVDSLFKRDPDDFQKNFIPVEDSRFILGTTISKLTTSIGGIYLPPEHVEQFLVANPL